MFMVTGSQADRADRNKVTLLKVSDMNKTHVNAGNFHKFYSQLMLMLSKHLIVTQMLSIIISGD